MKRILYILLTFAAFTQFSFAQEHRRYALVWHDEFDSNELDNKVWKKGAPKTNSERSCAV